MCYALTRGMRFQYENIGLVQRFSTYLYSHTIIMITIIIAIIIVMIMIITCNAHNNNNNDDDNNEIFHSIMIIYIKLQPHPISIPVAIQPTNQPTDYPYSCAVYVSLVVEVMAVNRVAVATAAAMAATALWLARYDVKYWQMANSLIGFRSTE